MCVTVHEGGVELRRHWGAAAVLTRVTPPPPRSAQRSSESASVVDAQIPPPVRKRAPPQGVRLGLGRGGIQRTLAS